MISGIYSIQFPSGKTYIGSASNLQTRRVHHLHSLRKGNHHNLPMQRAYLKYGEVGFIFKTLIICDRRNLLVYEQLLINQLAPEYNIAKVAGSPMLGRNHSSSTLAKMSQKTHTQETKEKMSNMRARAVLCVETGVVFKSSVTAGKWCLENGLTKNKYANAHIRANIVAGGSAYGFHWKRV